MTKGVAKRKALSLAPGAQAKSPDGRIIGPLRRIQPIERLSKSATVPYFGLPANALKD